MKTTTLLSAIALTASCAITPENMSTADSAQLCNTLADRPANREAIMDELARRHNFTNEEFASISERTVFVGMSEAALRCSWGRPWEIKKTVTKYGATSQWVYRYPGYRINQYGFAYTQGGKVVAVQGR